VQVYWTHIGATAAATEEGVLAYRVGSGGNGDATSGGGYVGVHSSGSNSETNGASAQGAFPLVMSIPIFNDTSQEWEMLLGFAVPFGVSVEAHLWVAVA
jgi:hypothetical protein